MLMSTLGHFSQYCTVALLLKVFIKSITSVCFDSFKGLFSTGFIPEMLLIKTTTNIPLVYNEASSIFVSQHGSSSWQVASDRTKVEANLWSVEKEGRVLTFALIFPFLSLNVI